MKYFPVTSENEAKSISAIVYKLTRPSGADKTETTKYALDWQFDKNGVCYLCVDEAFVLPIHKDRGGAVTTALRALQAARKLSKESADNIINVAAENAGGVVTVAQVIPPEWIAISVSDIDRPTP